MDFVDVELDGEVWEVAATYFPHVTIGEAEALAEENGCQLPSPRLADAIWLAADLKLKPLPRRHDGTPKTMSSPAVYADQDRRIAEQMGDTCFTLVDGCFKNVVRVGGVLALYGWHVEDGILLPGISLHLPVTPNLGGRIIQPIYTGHAKAWGDYSQGARLVRLKG